MQLKLRRAGQKLTSEDLDNNFMELEREINDARQRLEEITQELEKLRAGRATSSSESTVSVKISDSNGLEFNVPGLNVKGSFDESEKYIPGDFVYHDNAFWFAVAETQAGQEFMIRNWKRIFKFPNDGNEDDTHAGSSASAAAAEDDFGDT